MHNPSPYLPPFALRLSRGLGTAQRTAFTHLSYLPYLPNLLSLPHPFPSPFQVDLSFSAHSNARLHYDARKKHVAKQAKTLAANEAALKAAEKKAAQQLLQVREVWEAGGVHM